MKKLLFVSLMLIASIGYAQNYTVVYRNGWVCFDASVPAYSFQIDPTETLRPAIIYQDSILTINVRPYARQIKRQNFVSIDGVSCTGMTTTQILDRIRGIFSNSEKIHLISTSSQNGTDVAIPPNFRSGMIEWTNTGTGTVTIASADGKTNVLTVNYPARIFPISDNVVYSGYSIVLTGGATVQWSFNQ